MYAMKKIFLTLLVSGIFLACQSQNDAPGFGTVPPEVFEKLIREHRDLVLLDVRTPGEYANGKLDGAINLDIQAPDFEERLKALDKEAQYGVYCAVGRRSEVAMERMKTLGFTRVYDLGGGYQAWLKHQQK